MKYKDLQGGGLECIDPNRANAPVYCIRNTAMQVAGCWKIPLPSPERQHHLDGGQNLKNPELLGK